MASKKEGGKQLNPSECGNCYREELRDMRDKMLTILDAEKRKEAIGFTDATTKIHEHNPWGTRWEIKGKPERGNWTTSELYDLYKADKQGGKGE